MSLHELLLLAFMSLIARAASMALGDTSSSAESTHTDTRTDGGQPGTFTSATAEAATTVSNNNAFAPNSQVPASQSSSNALLAAVVPILAVSITLAAVVFRMYQNRLEQERVEVEGEKHVPAELEAGMIPIELEAREKRHARYSPR
jgi:hypothetical protein